MTKLIATKNFPFRGRWLKPGDSFNANAQTARALVHIRRAKEDFTPPQTYHPAVMTAEDPGSTETPVRPRRYRRRDMTADK